MQSDAHHRTPAQKRAPTGIKKPAAAGWVGNRMVVRSGSSLVPDSLQSV